MRLRTCGQGSGRVSRPMCVGKLHRVRRLRQAAGTGAGPRAPSWWRTRCSPASPTSCSTPPATCAPTCSAMSTRTATHSPHPRHARRIGVIGEPDVEREDRVDLERHQLRAHHMDIGRRPADAGTLEQRPQQRTGIVGGEFHQLAQLDIGEQPGEHFLALGLVGELHRKAVLAQVLDRLRNAVDRKIGRCCGQHRVNAPKPHHLDVGAGRPV